METIRLTLRYAIRSLLRQPGFAALAVLTLAVGIGVNTVAFTVVNALLFKPFRWDGARELGWIMVSAPADRYAEMSLPEYEDLARAARTFEAIAAQARMPVSLRDGDHAEQAWALLVSTNYLPALRVRPTTGRLFGADDLKATEVPAIVSHRFWRTRLGGASATGRTTIVNGRVVSIVGVLPDDFQGPWGLFEPEEKPTIAARSRSSSAPRATRLPSSPRSAIRFGRSMRTSRLLRSRRWRSGWSCRCGHSARLPASSSSAAPWHSSSRPSACLASRTSR